MGDVIRGRIRWKGRKPPSRTNRPRRRFRTLALGLVLVSGIAFVSLGSDSTPGTPSEVNINEGNIRFGEAVSKALTDAKSNLDISKYYPILYDALLGENNNVATQAAQALYHAAKNGYKIPRDLLQALKHNFNGHPSNDRGSWCQLAHKTVSM